MCVCTCVCVHTQTYHGTVQRSEDSLKEFVFFLPCGFQGSNSALTAKCLYLFNCLPGFV